MRFSMASPTAWRAKWLTRCKPDKVSILTGSMGSNNHTAAHSSYKKYRRRILATGAELYKFRHDPFPPAPHREQALEIQKILL